MRERGFSLLEVLIALAIVITLSTLLLATSSSYLERSRIAKFCQLARTLKEATYQYYIDTNLYPLKIEDYFKDRGIPYWRGPYITPLKTKRRGKIAISPWNTNLSIVKCPNSNPIGLRCRRGDFLGTSTVESEHVRLVLRITNSRGDKVIKTSSLEEIDKILDDGNLRRGFVIKRRRYLYYLLIAR